MAGQPRVGQLQGGAAGVRNPFHAPYLRPCTLRAAWGYLPKTQTKTHPPQHVRRVLAHGEISDSDGFSTDVSDTRRKRHREGDQESFGQSVKARL